MNEQLTQLELRIKQLEDNQIAYNMPNVQREILFSIVKDFLSKNINLGIGTSNPNFSALLDLTSVAKGLLLPRMITTQRNAITGVSGLVVYNTSTNKINVYTGAGWEAVTSA